MIHHGLAEISSCEQAQSYKDALNSQPQALLEGSRVYSHNYFPKGPCTHIVYTWALKGFPYSSFRGQVYTIEVHGPLGLYL